MYIVLTSSYGAVAELHAKLSSCIIHAPSGKVRLRDRMLYGMLLLLKWGCVGGDIRRAKGRNWRDAGRRGVTLVTLRGDRSRRRFRNVSWMSWNRMAQWWR